MAKKQNRREEANSQNLEGKKRKSIAIKQMTFEKKGGEGKQDMKERVTGQSPKHYKETLLRCFDYVNGNVN